MSNELILAISGNDIFSGGGLHADLATYTTNKQHGFVAVTCLTAMTEHGFEVIPVDPTTFAQQLNSLKDVSFSAIKLGLLPNVEVADLALDYVKAHSEIPVVLDPVLVCKESHDVEVSALRDELIKFFPYVTIITPNLPEAEILTQSKIQSLDDMKEAARKLHELGAATVVVKGVIVSTKKRPSMSFMMGRTSPSLKSQSWKRTIQEQVVPLRLAFPASW